MPGTVQAGTGPCKLLWSWETGPNVRCLAETIEAHRSDSDWLELATGGETSQDLKADILRRGFALFCSRVLSFAYHFSHVGLGLRKVPVCPLPGTSANTPTSTLPGSTLLTL